MTFTVDGKRQIWPLFFYSFHVILKINHTKIVKCLFTIHCKYKYFDSTVLTETWRQTANIKFYFCRLPFAVNVKLNLSNVGILDLLWMNQHQHCIGGGEVDRKTICWQKCSVQRLFTRIVGQRWESLGWGFLTKAKRIYTTWTWTWVVSLGVVISGFYHGVLR